MKITRKTLSLVLAAALTLSVFTGCAKSAPSSTPTAPSGSDVKPLKLTMLVPNNQNPYIKFDDREDYPVWQELKKLFEAKGLEIEFEVVAPDQYPTTVQTRIASGNDLPDIINLSSFDDASAMALANKGVIQPINKFVEKCGDGTFTNFIEKDYPFMKQLTTAPDGNIYWYTSVQVQTYQGKPATTNRVINIRKDWLEKLKLPVPTTTDDFIAVMKAFQDNDMNGNGVKDEIVTVDTSGDFFMTGIAQWFGLSNYLTGVDVKNGKIVSPWYQDGIKDYLKFMQRLVAEGLFDTDLIGATYEQTSQRMAENKVGATFDYCMQTWLEPSINAEGAEFLPIYDVNAGDYTPHLIVEPSFFSWHKWAISKDCENPEAVAALLDVLYSPEYETLTAWGIEGKSYEVVDGRRQLMEGVGNAFWEQNAKDHNTPGSGLWSGCVFPTVSLYTMESQFTSRPEHKNEYQKATAYYENVYPDAKYCYTAIATDEQNTRKSEIATDLSTYSSELVTDFVLGRASFDKWDEYMSQPKTLGLDELMAIEQSQLDKFN
ncbi:MAG: extracellular solute-binding protein, partial [Oscillospiraceae bacterium]